MANLALATHDRGMVLAYGKLSGLEPDTVRMMDAIPLPRLGRAIVCFSQPY
jgi:hypothetical protein